MAVPRNGFWFLHHVDSVQLGVVAGIMDIVRESFGPPMVGLGEHISLGFLKRNLKLGDLEDMVLGNGVRVRDLAMDLFVTIDPAPSAVMIEANLCFPWDRENGVNRSFTTFDDFSDPKLFDQIFTVLDDVWRRNVELFNRRELLEWVEATGISF